jgi:topoisomerase IA-like protein
VMDELRISASQGLLLCGMDSAVELLKALGDKDDVKGAAVSEEVRQAASSAAELAPMVMEEGVEKLYEMHGTHAFELPEGATARAVPEDQTEARDKTGEKTEFQLPGSAPATASGQSDEAATVE